MQAGYGATVTTTTVVPPQGGFMIPMPMMYIPSPSPSLRLRLIGARDLVVADLVSSDPYAEIYFNNVLQKSSTKKSTLNPVWNETFTLRADGIPQFLVISLRDKDDVGKDDPLGCVVLPLLDLIQGVEKEWMCPLQGVKRGLLHIALLAENFGYPPGSFIGYNPMTIMSGFYPNRPHRGPIPRGYGVKSSGVLYSHWEKQKKKAKKKAAKAAKVGGLIALEFLGAVVEGMLDG
jgi:hypothetical protein